MPYNPADGRSHYLMQDWPSGKPVCAGRFGPGLPAARKGCGGAVIVTEADSIWGEGTWCSDTGIRLGGIEWLTHTYTPSGELVLRTRRSTPGCIIPPRVYNRG